MRITIVVPHLLGGGAELVACKWAEGLAGLGNDVTVVLTHGESTGNPIPGAKVVPLAGNNTVSRLFALRKFLKQNGSQFVVGVMPYCNLLAVIASSHLRCRTAVSEHAIHSSASPNMTFSGRVQWQIAKRLYRKADVCVAVSHALASELSAACKVRHSRLWVLPNPVLSASTLALGALPEPSPPAQRICIVSPSRLVALKRLHLVIEAAQLLKMSGRLVELHFYGDGPDRERLEGLAAAGGLNAQFHGRVEKWWLEAPTTSVVVLTSGLEGFGNVLVEAAAHGLPSVASSKALGVSDACIPGVTAQLVSGDDAHDFADGIIRASAMAPLATSSVAADWLSRFTTEEVALVMERILNSTAPARLTSAATDETLRAPSASRI